MFLAVEIVEASRIEHVLAHLIDIDSLPQIGAEYGLTMEYPQPVVPVGRVPHGQLPPEIDEQLLLLLLLDGTLELVDGVEGPLFETAAPHLVVRMHREVILRERDAGSLQMLRHLMILYCTIIRHDIRNSFQKLQSIRLLQKIAVGIVLHGNGHAILEWSITAIEGLDPIVTINLFI
jgi:hypothetical protein